MNVHWTSNLHPMNIQWTSNEHPIDIMDPMDTSKKLNGHCPKRLDFHIPMIVHWTFHWVHCVEWTSTGCTLDFQWTFIKNRTFSDSARSFSMCPLGPLCHWQLGPLCTLCPLGHCVYWIHCVHCVHWVQWTTFARFPELPNTVWW